MLDPQTALLYAMILASASDRNMSDNELLTIGEIVRIMPAFEDMDHGKLPEHAASCVGLLGRPDGLEKTLDEIREALPERLRETAYALACDVVASDLVASQEELRLLELIRHRLGVERLIAAAIERGARARFQRP